MTTRWNSLCKKVAAAAYSLKLSVAAPPHWDDASMKTARRVADTPGPSLPPEVTINASPQSSTLSSTPTPADLFALVKNDPGLLAQFMALATSEGRSPPKEPYHE